MINILHIFAEIMDFGYPQNLSPEILKLYITQEGVRSPFSSKVRLHMLLNKYIEVHGHGLARTNVNHIEMKKVRQRNLGE